MRKEIRKKSLTSQKMKKKKKDESLEVKRQFTNPARKSGTIT